MFPCALFLCFFGVIPTKPPALVTAAVHVDGRGPFRFLVDTGAQSTMIQASLASELKLQPEFRVELVTVNGTRLTPGAKLRTLRLGATVLPELEVLFHDLTEARRLDPAIRGVLGANALAHFDYSLTPRTGRLDTGTTRPLAGEVIPFSVVDGRITVQARMGREDLALALDSGASHMVLFRTPEAMAKTHAITTTVSTMDGARNVVPTVWTADMTFAGRLRIGMQPAAIVGQDEAKVEGLLPASLFKKIFVDHARRELVVER